MIPELSNATARATALSNRAGLLDALMATRKRSGKTPCKQQGCTTGCQATYRDLTSERYASKTLCTKCGQAAKERGELVVGQTMWRNAMRHQALRLLKDESKWNSFSSQS